MKNFKFQLILIFLSGFFCGLLGAWLELPWIVYFAYAPLMYGLMFSNGRRQFVYSFCAFFMPYFFTQLSFLLTVYNLMPLNKIISVALVFIAFLLLTLWEMLLMFLPVYTFLWIKKGGVSDVFSLSVLICMGEWLTENMFFLSFPWSGAWLSVTGSPLLCQPANLFGARFVSFLILCISGLGVRLVFRPQKAISMICVLSVCGFSFFYGNYSLKNTEKIIAESSESIGVMAAQGDAEGGEKRKIPSDELAAQYQKIINDNWVDGTKLILLPESAIPIDYSESADEFLQISKLAHDKNCTIVTGCFCNCGDYDYNSIYAFLPDETVSEPYLKQILVPFGEKIPLAWLFGADTLHECSDKEKILPLKGEGCTIGTVICIESIYSSIVKSQSENGAEILCISTNDSWFGKSFARGQHYRHSIMRAVENRRFLVRAGNCGISSVISPTGEQITVKSDMSSGAVTAQAKLISEKSFYAKTGDLFAALGMLIVTAAVCRRYGIRK